MNTRIGDFKCDTIIGRNHKKVLVSIIAGASKDTMLMKVAFKQAHGVANALIEPLELIKDKVYTFTTDNGLEFSKHKEASAKLNAEFYFAKPYRSRKKGLNEQTNGLVRQYLPKKTDVSKVTDEEVKKIEHLLNNRPRKSLNFKMPIAVFNQRNLRYN